MRSAFHLLLVFLACGVTSPVVLAQRPGWLAEGRSGMVASDSAAASRAGCDILQAGGNAVDAAAAVSFALGVTRPYSTGLGGGGFMIVRLADGQVIVLDYRETAPAKATPDMFAAARRHDGPSPHPSRYGYLAACVPGVLAGQCRALSCSGTLPLSRVLEPAIHLAETGFELDEHFVDSATAKLDVYKKNPALRDSCGYVFNKYLGGSRLPRAGDRLVQPELARLLRSIAKDGPAFFYHGPVAEAIERAMCRRGGIMTAGDLAAYEVKQREPLRTAYRDYTIISLPPPSSGGIAIAETLNVLEHFDLGAVARRDAGLAAHYQIEALKHAFADRARWLGDPDFVPVPISHLTSGSYAAGLAKRIDEFHTAAMATYGCAQLPEDGGTSHFCVVDRWGNVVVATETINLVFGSLAAVEEWGLILNNEMDDFSAEPGKANAFGLMQSKRNAVAPGKRPLSSMSPTIVLKGGEPVLLLGASGGPRIISSVLSVLLGVTDYGLTLEQAMLQPRPHHQWRPNEVVFDSTPPRHVVEGLIKRGHRIAAERKKGIVQAILKTESGWLGASDPRKGGRPAGY
jgi:gamma-glutamyltranspeptidase/glutathione hydrolase